MNFFIFKCWFFFALLALACVACNESVPFGFRIDVVPTDPTLCGPSPCSAQCCNDICRDIQSNKRHCGGCHRFCDFDQRCVRGRCISTKTERCPEGQRRCNGLCVDIRNNPQHCGACAQACPSDQRCVERKCIAEDA